MEFSFTERTVILSMNSSEATPIEEPISTAKRTIYCNLALKEGVGLPSSWLILL
jgi:hypothetical protein